MNDTTTVIQAIKDTKKFFPDVWKNLLRHRLPSNDAAGVYFQFKKENELENVLLTTQWKRSDNPLIGDGDEVFIAPISGLMAFEQVEKLPSKAVMSVEVCKDTGKATLVLRSICRDIAIQTYLIIGKKEGKRVVLDFQPGEPISATKIDVAKISDRTHINKATAIELGVEWVRLI